MPDYIIATTSTSDLPRTWLDEHQIPFLSYTFTINETAAEDDCREENREKIYAGMRKGDLLTTSMINAFVYEDFFRQLLGTGKNVLFAATVGTPFDRLIASYSRLEPSKALILQAIGAERIESLCDAFCDHMNTELKSCGKSLRTRVSPGYGDIPLSMQRSVFKILDCERKIGLTLNESLLMSPSKSVTAIAGIGVSRVGTGHTCAACDRVDCAYRK